MPLTQKEEIKCAIARTVQHCADWLRLGFDCWLRKREARGERREARGKRQEARGKRQEARGEVSR